MSLNNAYAHAGCNDSVIYYIYNLEHGLFVVKYMTIREPTMLGKMVLCYYGLIVFLFFVVVF